jgi:phosphate-selective porin OprO/OprP
MLKQLSIGMVSAGALVAAYPAFAQDAGVDSRIAALQRQILRQQQQLQQQQVLLESLISAEKQDHARADQAETAAATTKAQIQTMVNAAVQPAVAAATPPGPTITMSPRNRPGWRSADGRNSIELGALFQLDGGLDGFHPTFPGQKTTKIQSGVNARRMQIGVAATFQDDWHLNLTYDFGNSDETIGASGGPTAGFKVALASYTGLKPFGTRSSIELGYQTPPIFLDETLGSSNGLFMEHPTPDRLATGFASGEGRSTFGMRDYTKRFFGTFMFTGPKAGDDHTQASGTEQLAAVGRFTYNILQGRNDLLHIGGGFQRLLQPTYKSGSTFDSASLSDEAELRVDPTNIISVPFGSATNPVTGGGTYSAEIAGVWGPVLAAAEYYHYDAERRGLSEVDFNGAYGEVTYSITGEQHPYVPSTGSFGPIYPDHPFSFGQHTWGAWEVAARYSWADMNDAPNTSSAIRAGLDRDFTLGLNWYPNNNVKFQINWMHGSLAAPATSLAGASTLPNNFANTPGHWDELAIRTQFGF